MKFRYTKVAAAALVMLFSCSIGAMAATNHHLTKNFKVTASVKPSCDDFAVGNISFGQLSPFPPYSVVKSVPEPISYRCTLGTQVELGGSGSCAIPSDDGDTYWAMCDGTHTVDYNLYMAGSYVYESSGDCGPDTSVKERPSRRFTDNETDYPYVDAGSGFLDATQYLCARIPTDPSPATGSIWVGSNTAHYADHVTLTLYY